jgi:formate hydrogenlyase transcriptional activator
MGEPPEIQPAFELLLIGLSKSFIDLPAEAIDGQIEHAAGLIGSFAGADRVTVRQLAEDAKTFTCTHQWVRDGFSRGQEEELIDRYPWWARHVFVDGDPVVFSRLDELPAEAAGDRDSFERLGIGSIATFPLATEGSVVGALSFVTLGHERQWRQELLDRLRLASDILACTIARKHAHLELVRNLAFERLIAELAAAAVNLDVDATDDHVSRVLASVCERLDVDRSHIVQQGLDDGVLHVTHQWVREGFPRIPAIVLEESLPWLVERVRSGNTLLFSRVDDIPPEATREREFARLHGAKSFAILPLIHAGVVMGGVTFGCFRREQAWPRDLVERLRLVSNLLASALARRRTDLELRAALTENELLRQKLETENLYLRADVASARTFIEIVGRSSAIRAVLHKVDQVAPTDAPVLLLGETGTGKELVAHAIQRRSGRSARPLITVNCAALPPTLIESELFGHEKGAFTGATQARAGRFELADGGTLFLDEIGDLDPALQSKLLRTLQSGEIQRIGSQRAKTVDVRVIAATNRDLETAMQEGRFRADLYYRLGVFPIEVPPLRERREDIPLLVWHFIQSRQRALGRPLVKEISPAGMEALTTYDWPGNVRELQNIIDRALILSNGPVLRLDEAFGSPRPARSPRGEHSAETLRDTERAHILSVLERCRWVIEGRGQAADRLGLRPSTLRNRMRKLGIRRPAAR